MWSLNTVWSISVGYERVVAIGCYQLEPATNLAELSFSVLKDWQRKGLGRIIQFKLAQTARENGIQGLVAYLSSKNTGMIKLFNSLPYKVNVKLDSDLAIMTAYFKTLIAREEQHRPPLRLAEDFQLWS